MFQQSGRLLVKKHTKQQKKQKTEKQQSLMLLNMYVINVYQVLTYRKGIHQSFRNWTNSKHSSHC